MIIQLKKFGTTLVSRPSGKEALLAFRPMLNQINENEEVIIDFKGVMVLTPSWADEFLTPLSKQFGERIQLRNMDNSSIKATLSILNKIKNNNF